MANFWERDLPTAAVAETQWWLGDVPVEEEEEETPFWTRDEPTPEGDDIYASFGQDAFDNPQDAEIDGPNAIELVGGRVATLGKMRVRRTHSSSNQG